MGERKEESENYYQPDITRAKQNDGSFRKQKLLSVIGLQLKSTDTNSLLFVLKTRTCINSVCFHLHVFKSTFKYYNYITRLKA